MKTKGYADPYDSEPLVMNRKSTKENPNVVYTLEKHRVVGCICEEDTHHINYMHLTLNETKRCECGHWFTCKERKLPDLSDYGVHLDAGHH
jgi:cytochrome c oxidase subunit 5b